MKKILCILLAILLIPTTLAFVGCDKQEEKTLEEQFAIYHNLEEKVRKINLKSGTLATVMTLEKVSGYPSKVVMSLDNLFTKDADLYIWLKSSVENKKKDLKAVGDMVIDFAKANSWNNNYDLYISFSYDTNTETIYDYETEKLYVPNVDMIFIEMYEKFGVCSTYSVKSKNGGIDWLVSKELGEIKHGEYENDYEALDSMYIYCYGGEFSIRNRNLSTAY